MDKKQYQDFLKSVKQCQERSRKTLATIDDTLLGVKQTLKDIQETNENIDKIKQQYNTERSTLAQKISKSFNFVQDPFKKQEGITYDHLPQQISEESMAAKILKHKRILIMTGAGVSADSGIPTFRGKEGLYTNGFSYKGKQYTPEQFITFRNFAEEPQGIWNWIEDIYNMSIKAEPNQIHRQIDFLAKNLAERGKEVVLATQNIDDLHLKPQNNEYQYYNIHGNCKLLRCNLHHFISYSAKSKNQNCDICGQALRPHVLFFDESYGKNYGEQIKDKSFPLVICIGSSVKTGLAITMLRRADQIIEINPQPVLQVGRVYRFTRDTANVLRKMNSALLQSKKA